MKLVVWNCKGAFLRKHSLIAELNADVLVLPEAGQFTDIPQLIARKPIRSTAWVGSSRSKGLGVIAYGAFTLRVHESYDERLRWILPVVVEGPTPFTLFAVWTVPHIESKLYAHCLFEALEVYQPILRTGRSVFAGDFNNNVLLDAPRHRYKFADWIERAAELGLESVYHSHRGIAHGEETHPTFFLHHKPEKPHHLDYVFATPDLRAAGYAVNVGEFTDWAKSSDHMPVICTFGVDGFGASHLTTD